MAAGKFQAGSVSAPVVFLAKKEMKMELDLLCRYTEPVRAAGRRDQAEGCR